MTKLHSFASEAPRSSIFKMKVNGQELDVLHHSVAHFASFECDGPVEIQIETEGQTSNAIVRPLKQGITPVIRNGCVQFTLPGPQYLQIEIEGLPLLYLYALAPAGEPPAGQHVKRFEGGKIHEAGEIVLAECEVCWIDAGAIVRGNIRAVATSGVQIGGYGVLDGSYWVNRGGRRRQIVLDHCRDSRVETVLMIGPTHWMVSLGSCDGITVDGIRQIANDMSSDGVDICGSRNVIVTGCCLHNGDDNVAIKALQNCGRQSGSPLAAHPGEWDEPVENILVKDCMFYNVNGGTAMEVGYETQVSRMSNIRFENIDVLAVHNFGSVFGIHNGDRALIEDVVWENIRVEHHYDRLVDFRVSKCRYSKDAQRGQIRNITLRNIKVTQSESNAGYTLSMMIGSDAAHPVTGIHFEDFELGGTKILNADQLDLVTRHAENITFC